MHLDGARLCLLCLCLLGHNITISSRVMIVINWQTLSQVQKHVAWLNVVRGTLVP